MRGRLESSIIQRRRRVARLDVEEEEDEDEIFDILADDDSGIEADDSAVSRITSKRTRNRKPDDVDVCAVGSKVRVDEEDEGEEEEDDEEAFDILADDDSGIYSCR